MTVSYDPYASLEQPWEPIGKYVFKFGLLERMVDEAPSVVMGVSYEDVGQHVASNLGFLAKCTLIKGIGSDADGGLKQPFADIFKELEEQHTFRNSLGHGAWIAHFETDDEHGIWCKEESSRRYNFKSFSVTREELETNANKLDELSGKIRQRVIE